MTSMKKCITMLSATLIASTYYSFAEGESSEGVMGTIKGGINSLLSTFTTSDSDKIANATPAPIDGEELIKTEANPSDTLVAITNGIEKTEPKESVVDNLIALEETMNRVNPMPTPEELSPAETPSEVEKTLETEKAAEDIATGASLPTDLDRKLNETIPQSQPSSETADTPDEQINQLEAEFASGNPPRSS
jgi:hypothetical protein